MKLNLLKSFEKTNTSLVMRRKSIIELWQDSINTQGPKPKQSQFRLLEAKYFPKTTGSYNETPYVKSTHSIDGKESFEVKVFFLSAKQKRRMQVSFCFIVI